MLFDRGDRNFLAGLDLDAVFAESGWNAALQPGERFVVIRPGLDLGAARL